MNELALFAGAGGGLLGSRLLDWRTVCAVEIDKYCQRVLLQRQRDGHLVRFPIWDDVRTFDGNEWCGRVDVVTAGFPCPAFSQARGGKNPDPWANTKNMWPHTFRIINEVKPAWCLLENVPGLLSGSHGYFGKVLRDMAKGGFSIAWDVLSAADEGADHIRDRLWILGYSNSNCEPDVSVNDEASRLPVASANTSSDCSHKYIRPHRVEEEIQGARNYWEVEPRLARVANGVADFMDRSKAIGNGQVPAVVVRAWQELSKQVSN